MTHRSMSKRRLVLVSAVYFILVNSGLGKAEHRYYVPTPDLDRSSCIVRLASPAEDATMNQRRIGQGKFELAWRSSWTACPGATRYHLYVIGPGTLNPVVDVDTLSGTSFPHRATHYGRTALEGWKWRVRAHVDGAWGEWSTNGTFNVSPADERTIPQATEVCTISGQVRDAKREYGTKVGLYLVNSSKEVFPPRSLDNKGRYRFQRVPVGEYRVRPIGRFPGGKADIGPIPGVRRVRCEANGNLVADFRIGSLEG